MPPRTTGSVGSPEISSAGTPNPTRYTTRIVGTPRKTSVKTTASARSGNSAGAPVVRTSATTRPRTRTAISTVTKIVTSSQKPLSTAGNDVLNASGSKNVARTLSQPGLVTSNAASPPTTTTADPAAIASPRRARRRSAAARTARRSSGATAVTVGLLQHRRAGGGAHEALLERLELAAFAEVADRLAHALRQRRALLQQRRPLVAARRAELADDLRARHLRRREEERGREVDDDRVDLLLLERGDDVVRVVEDLRLRAGLDDLLDGVEARRPDLHAELGVRHVGKRRGLRRVRGLQRDERLGRGVVRRREVHALRARGRDRDLVDVEVKLLRAGRVGGVERLGDPLHLALCVPELLRDRVRERALEAAPVRRVVVLEIGRERRLVGRDRERAGRPGLQRLLRAGVGGARLRRRGAARRRRARAGVVARPARGEEEGDDGGGDQGTSEAAHGANPNRRRGRSGDDLDARAEARAERLLQRHVEVAERLELARAAQRARVDRAQAAVLDQLLDGRLCHVVVAGDEDVERLARALARDERACKRRVAPLAPLRAVGRRGGAFRFRRTRVE